MNSIDNPKETVKKPARSPLVDGLGGELAREAREADNEVAGFQARDRGSNNGNGGAPPDGSDEPPAGRMSELPFGPQFAIRLGDGAMLMAVEGHADDRDLSGREVWTCFVLTPKEAQRARETMDHAEHAAASAIAFKLPRKP